jgi:D-ribulokinase
MPLITVAIGIEDGPVSVARLGEDDRNVIVWMDHRAADQAEKINAKEHAVLRHVGGKISPEMEAPKV